jgi:hypothetical protein
MPSNSRLQNDYGADLWVRESDHKKHVSVPSIDSNHLGPI